MATPHVLVYIVSIRHKQKGAKLPRKWVKLVVLKLKLVVSAVTKCVTPYF